MTTYPTLRLLVDAIPAEVLELQRRVNVMVAQYLDAAIKRPERLSESQDRVEGRLPLEAIEIVGQNAGL